DLAWDRAPYSGSRDWNTYLSRSKESPGAEGRTFSSSSLDCLLQCEVYRLLERQSTAFLPGAVEGSVISQSRACGGHPTDVAGTFKQRRSDFLPQSLGCAPDADGARRAAKSGDHYRQRFQGIGNPRPVAQLAPDHEPFLEQLPRDRL